ncbi:MAG: hypothetical protein KGO81_15155, partial [Bacteroidota bacterium]|nr:hypothetical protein [Bacteroidota bacterium]
LRTAFKSSILKASDSRMVSRLTTQMMKVIQADAVSVRGMRNVIDGEATLLQGFEFNSGGKLSTTLFAPFTPTIDRATGKASVHLAPFVATEMISAPAGATHYRILTAAASVDFEKELYEQDNQQSVYLALEDAPTEVIDLEVTLPVGSTHPLFLGLGLEFLQEVNGVMYPLKNGAFNAFSLVKVDVE